MSLPYRRLLIGFLLVMGSSVGRADEKINCKEFQPQQLVGEPFYSEEKKPLFGYGTLYALHAKGGNLGLKSFESCGKTYVAIFDSYRFDFGAEDVSKVAKVIEVGKSKALNMTYPNKDSVWFSVRNFQQLSCLPKADAKKWMTSKKQRPSTPADVVAVGGGEVPFWNEISESKKVASSPSSIWRAEANPARFVELPASEWMCGRTDTEADGI